MLTDAYGGLGGWVFKILTSLPNAHGYSLKPGKCLCHLSSVGLYFGGGESHFFPSSVVNLTQKVGYTRVFLKTYSFSQSNIKM